MATIMNPAERSRMRIKLRLPVRPEWRDGCPLKPHDGGKGARSPALCLQSGGVDLAKPRALSVGEPPLYSAEQRGHCCTLLLYWLAPRNFWHRLSVSSATWPAAGDPSAAWNMSFPSSKPLASITNFGGRFTRHDEHLT
jgi:hypothetical protein